jgi:hypothetical protein
MSGPDILARRATTGPEVLLGLFNGAIKLRQGLLLSHREFSIARVLLNSGLSLKPLKPLKSPWPLLCDLHGEEDYEQDDD